MTVSLTQAPLADLRSKLSDAELDAIDVYWRAANYLSVGQIYLLDNPLLREPLRLEHIKPRLLGHWGTTPGLNLIYAHLNRVICHRDLNAIFVTGPGHGGPGVVANTYMEGTYGEVYPEMGFDEDGVRRLFRQFSFPGGIPSHVAPETPGSIHEGGELGYALVHAFGAAFDNPDRVLRGRRRRGGNRPARSQLAFQQVPQRGTRRRGAPDPAPQRLQDRQSDRPGADRS
jgi:xylulose-5-phosphate/fructose-6-phosphate phosphoketolase